MPLTDTDYSGVRTSLTPLTTRLRMKNMCEDYPCCGHEQGCCPSYDENGQQTNMICTCGAELPLNNRFSICDTCLRSDDDDDRYYDDEE